MRRIVTLTLVVVLSMLAACGDDDDTVATPDATAPTTGAAGADDESAIQDAIVSYLVDGNCDAMTDQFLEDQSFVTDGREEACAAFEDLFTPPAYTAEDIVISDVEIDGDKASATVGDNFSNVTSDYKLLNVDGQWQIDSVDL